MMKKKVLPIIISLVFLLSMFAGVGFAISPNEQAKAYANQQFKDGVANFTLESFNYASPNEISRSCLGDPFKNIYINIDSFDENKSFVEASKPMSFYTFPIMVDGKAISDLTIGLVNGDWQVIDVGGNQSKLIENMAKENDVKTDSINILRCGGETYFVSQKNGKEIVYSPYVSDSSLDLKVQQTVSIDKIKEHMKQRQQQFFERKHNPKFASSIGGESFGIYPDNITSFDQKDSLGTRVLRFVKYEF